MPHRHPDSPSNDSRARARAADTGSDTDSETDLVAALVLATADTPAERRIALHAFDPGFDARHGTFTMANAAAALLRQRERETRASAIPTSGTAPMAASSGSASSLESESPVERQRAYGPLHLFQTVEDPNDLALEGEREVDAPRSTSPIRRPEFPWATFPVLFPPSQPRPAIRPVPPQNRVPAHAQHLAADELPAPSLGRGGILADIWNETVPADVSPCENECTCWKCTVQSTLAPDLAPRDRQSWSSLRQMLFPEEEAPSALGPGPSPVPIPGTSGSASASVFDTVHEASAQPRREARLSPPSRRSRAPAAPVVTTGDSGLASASIYDTALRSSAQPRGERPVPRLSLRSRAPASPSYGSFRAQSPARSLSREGPLALSAATLNTPPWRMHRDHLLELERAKITAEEGTEVRAESRSLAGPSVARRAPVGTLRGVEQTGRAFAPRSASLAGFEPRGSDYLMRRGIPRNIARYLATVIRAVTPGERVVPQQGQRERVQPVPSTFAGGDSLASAGVGRQGPRESTYAGLPRNPSGVAPVYDQRSSVGDTGHTQSPAAGPSRAPAPGSTTTAASSSRSATAPAASSRGTDAHLSVRVTVSPVTDDAPTPADPSAPIPRQPRSRYSNHPSFLTRLRDSIRPAPPVPQQRVLIFPVPQPGQCPNTPSPYDALIHERDGTWTYAPTLPYPHPTIFESSQPLHFWLDPTYLYRHYQYLSRDYVTRYADALDPNDLSAAPALVPASRETIDYFHQNTHEYWPAQDDDLEVERRRYGLPGHDGDSTRFRAGALTPLPVADASPPICVICGYPFVIGLQASGCGEDGEKVSTRSAQAHGETIFVPAATHRKGMVDAPGLHASMGKTAE